MADWITDPPRTRLPADHGSGASRIVVRVLVNGVHGWPPASLPRDGGQGALESLETRAGNAEAPRLGEDIEGQEGEEARLAAAGHHAPGGRIAVGHGLDDKSRDEARDAAQAQPERECREWFDVPS
jgi:hypothetical protein